MREQMIQEALNGIRDEYITESCVKLGILGAGALAAGAAADAAGGVILPSSGTAAKAGFGAWLAKGGWVALVAGVVVAAGVAAGAFFFGKSGDMPPVGSDTSVEETTPSDSLEETKDETQDDTAGETEAVTEDESETESDTQAPDDPLLSLPLRISDFSKVDLSLFTTDQGKVSVTSEGKLMMAADWVQGSYTDSSATWVPHALMPYAPAYTESAPYTPGAIVMKYKVVNGDNGQPDFYFKGAGDTDAQATYTHATVYEDWDNDYRYLIIRTDSVDSYMNGEQPTMTMAWLHLGNNFATCDGRSMTIEEMIFYPSTTDALLGFSDYLEENGVVTEILYSNNDVGYRIVYANPQYTNPILHIPSYAPDGLPVKEITNYAYRGNTFLFTLTVDEGVEYIRYDAFTRCTSLATAYLPDSLIYLDQHVFSGCSALTEIHLGNGLRVMEYGALPLSSEAFTDIYYNGTMADWYRITRRNPTAEHAITVHCTDGELDYSDPAPEVLPNTQDEVRDLSAILANAPLMELLEGEVMVSCEARVIRLKQGAYGEYKEFILRYGLFQGENVPRYGFDILSAEDGSLVAKPEITPAMYRIYGTGGMLYFEEAFSGNVDAMVFLYDYGIDESGNLAYRTQYYGIDYKPDGTLYIHSNYHLSPDPTDAGYVDKRMTSRELVRFIRVLSTLSDDVNAERYGSHGYYLMSSAPDGTVTLFTPKNAPLFDPALPETVSLLKLSEVLNPDLTAFYETYAPRKRE